MFLGIAVMNVNRAFPYQRESTVACGENK